MTLYCDHHATHRCRYTTAQQRLPVQVHKFIIIIYFISSSISEIGSTGTRGRVIRAVRMGVRVGWRHPSRPVPAVISGSPRRLYCTVVTQPKNAYTHITLYYYYYYTWSGADRMCVKRVPTHTHAYLYIYIYIIK